MCSFRGYSILVAEDQPLIALSIRAMLREANARVIAAHDVCGAVALAEEAPLSAAILDIELGTGDCIPVCEVLASRRIPFMFYTGFCEHPVLDAWPATPILSKPATRSELLASLRGLLEAARPP